MSVRTSLRRAIALGSTASQEVVWLFITSEKTDTVGAYRGTVPNLALVHAIPVGPEPHNLGILAVLAAGSGGGGAR